MQTNEAPSAVILERRRDTAKKLGVSESQLIKWEREGLLQRIDLPGLRAVRYDARETSALAERFIEQSRQRNS